MSGFALSEAVRLWLLREKVEAEGRTQAKVARALGVTQERFNHWLSGRNRVPPDSYLGIATYFRFSDEATWIAEVRRLYPAPTDHVAPPRLTHPATPELVREYLRQSDEAMTRSRPPRPARPAGARKAHGRP